jgi:hypothetical protein
MISRAVRCLVALALCCSVGGQWIALQSIAWTTMLVEYSQQCSFKQAIVQTFDGNHPCALCKHVSKGKASEKNQERVRVATKTDLICAATKFALRPPVISFEYRSLMSSPVTSFHRPLSPPPRRALS